MVKLFCRALIAAGALLASPALALTDMDERKSFVITRTASPPTIDGWLDDAVWQQAAVIDDFHQTDPGDGEPPTEDTVVRVLYDDDYLYISADLRDSDPSGIQATQMIQGRTFFPTTASGSRSTASTTSATIIFSRSTPTA
ncbi:MAG: sugar-binding protein [Woeseia sp.]